MSEQILKLAQEKITTAVKREELQAVKVIFFGKQGLISHEMQKLKNLSADDKKHFGSEINNLKEHIQKLIDQKESLIEEQELQQRWETEKLDLTIPARPGSAGTIHPITQVMEELVQIFAGFGFTVKTGPSIESDWYNFTALNIGENHPARQMHDTFYLQNDGNESVVLRTHTSPIQIRTMENGMPPFRFIAPGRTYRSDSDMTHSPMFHQIEGVMVDEGINMGHLKYIIIEFIKQFFENSAVEVRFRPSFFPFTEPSAEVDIRLKNNSKWLEVLGCGMVHPQVLRNAKVDAKKYSGFAFGLGIERFAMLKYGIDDLRQFFEGDRRRLKYYGFSSFDIPSLVGGLSK